MTLRERSERFTPPLQSRCFSFGNVGKYFVRLQVSQPAALSVAPAVAWSRKPLKRRDFTSHWMIEVMWFFHCFLIGSKSSKAVGSYLEARVLTVGKSHMTAWQLNATCSLVKNVAISINIVISINNHNYVHYFSSS